MAWKHQLITLFLSVMLSACAGTDSGRYYEPPSGTTQENGATIVGSRVPQSFPPGDQIAYVFGVSGKRIRGGKDAFSRPVLLAPGTHKIAIAWTQGSLFGIITLPIDITAGESLVIKHQRYNKEMASIWLEDARTNIPLGDTVFVHVASPE